MAHRYNLKGSLPALLVCMLVVVTPAFSPAVAQEASEASPGSTIVVLNMYYANPGMADAVLQTRLEASEIRQGIGLPRGRILRRVNDAAELPDIMWECEFSDIAAHDADMAARAGSDRFEGVREKMSKRVNRFERTIWQVAHPGDRVQLKESGLPSSALGTGAIVVTNWYFAKPGQEHAVLDHRIHASVVRQQLGGSVGRVFARLEQTGFEPASGDLPGVLWQIELPSLEARKKDLDTTGSTPEFEAVMEHMGTLLRKFDRGVWEVL